MWRVYILCFLFVQFNQVECRINSSLKPQSLSNIIATEGDTAEFRWGITYSASHRKEVFSKIEILLLDKEACALIKRCTIGDTIWKQNITEEGKRLFKNKIQVHKVYSKDISPYAGYASIILILTLSEVDLKDNGHRFSVYGFMYSYPSFNGTELESPAINLTVLQFPVSRLRIEITSFTFNQKNIPEVKWNKPSNYDGIVWYYVEIRSSKYTILYGPINKTSFCAYGVMDPKVAVVYAENKYTKGNRSVPMVFDGKFTNKKPKRKWYRGYEQKIEICWFWLVVGCLGQTLLLLFFISLFKCCKRIKCCCTGKSRCSSCQRNREFQMTSDDDTEMKRFGDEELLSRNQDYEIVPDDLDYQHLQPIPQPANYTPLQAPDNYMKMT
uniref:Cnidarian restricted protein n=1 Tax=Clytia hemisphaerica TaxID=252671 RepID=A0A7M5WS84_9CNID